MSQPALPVPRGCYGAEPSPAAWVVPEKPAGGSGLMGAPLVSFRARRRGRS